jgi:protein Mpv17
VLWFACAAHTHMCCHLSSAPTVPPDNLWAYEGSVEEYGVITKAATSMVAYGIGDFLAQCLKGEDLTTIDLKRSARSALAGLVVHGPMVSTTF